MLHGVSLAGSQEKGGVRVPVSRRQLRQLRVQLPLQVRVRRERLEALGPRQAAGRGPATAAGRAPIS